MAFNTQKAFALMAQLREITEGLIEMPELQPVARQILQPLLNGGTTDAPRTGRRSLSEETRAKMRAAAQKRWAAKKGKGKK